MYMPIRGISWESIYLTINTNENFGEIHVHDTFFRKYIFVRNERN